MTTTKLIEQTKDRITHLQRQLDDERLYLRCLEEQLDREDAKTVDYFAALESEVDTFEDLGIRRSCCPYHSFGGDPNNSCGGDKP
jgi:DNA-directed RNA polymerase subunit N (RpoN/RPB10)